MYLHYLFYLHFFAVVLYTSNSGSHIGNFEKKYFLDDMIFKALTEVIRLSFD